MKSNLKNLHRIRGCVIGDSGSNPDHVDYWLNHLFVFKISLDEWRYWIW